MRNPQEKDFSVYEFSEEEAAVGRSTELAMLKFGRQSENPKGDAAAADETVDFLEAFGSRKRLTHSGRVDAVCMVIDRSNSNCASSGHVSHEMSVSEQKTAAHASDPPSSVEEILMSSSGALDHLCQGSQGNMIDDCLAECPIEMTASSLSLHVGNIHYSCVLPESASNITQSDVSSDLSEGHMPCSSSSHSSEDGEAIGSLDPQDLAAQTGAEDKDVDAAVIVTPDYLVYQDELYAESQLTFSVDSIRIECFDANRGEGPLILDWAIADLLLIGCSWNGNIETAFIEVQSKETDSSGDMLENEHDLSGIMCVMFTVCGSQWSSKEKKIMLLAPTYRDLWKSGLDIRGNKFSSILEESIPFYPRQQLHDFEEAMEDIVYPHGDPDAVSMSKRDVELLQPETFINDTIIDFYIKYLKDKIQINERNRFHFFNSFFFRKLVDLDKDPKNIGDGRAAFLRVRKWTRKINIFEKDFIFIPVNFNLHWSLLVICHPGEVMSLQNEEIDKSLRVPCILHLDSIKGSHSGLRGLIQSYLLEEWKERHMESVEDASSNFLNLRFVPLELPQQENYYDCGLFLLHYVELFLEAAPVNFNPFKITTFSNFLSVDWFVPSEASFKRFLIRNLLYELLGSKKQSDLSELCNGDRLSPHFPNDGHAINAVPQPDLVPATVVNDASTHLDDNRIELDLFKGSSIAPHIKDDHLDQQLLDTNANEGNSSHKINFNFEPVASFGALKCAMPTIMEDEEDLVHSEIWGTCRTVNGNSDETCSTSRLSGEPLGQERLGSPEGLIQIEEDHAICGFLSEPPGSRYSKESEKTLVEISTDNSDHLPCENSESLYNSDEEKNRLISSDDSEQPSAKKDISHSEEDMNGLCIEVTQVPEPCNPLEVIQDDEKLELMNITIPEISETCTVQLVTTIPESPETRMKCSQVGENTAIAFSRQDGVENVNSNLPEACDVVLDSPDRNLKPAANRTEETPGFSTVGDDETPGVSASANRCHSVLCIESSNDASDNDNSKATSEDLVVLEEGRRRKRRKVHHSGIPRKQTRSVTRTISF